MSTLSCSDTDNAENSSPEKLPRKADAKRRNLKTQAERRRRARINEHFQNLHDILHALDASRLERTATDGSLVTSIAPIPCASSSTVGAPTSSASNSDQRMEKAEILEKAVKRINLLESNLKSSESREERCFLTGFKHCAMQLYKFVQGQTDLDTVSKQRICSSLMLKIRESNFELKQMSSDSPTTATKVFQPATSSPIKRPLDNLTNSPSKPFPGGAPLELKAFHQNNKENATRRHVTYHEDPPGMQTLLEDAYEESPNDSRLNASACCTNSRSPITVSNNWKSHGTQLRINNGFRPMENATFVPSCSKLARPESSSGSKMARLDENFSSAKGVPVWRPW